MSRAPRRLDYHFATQNAAARYAPPGEIHGAAVAAQHRVIRGSDGTPIFVWLCLCGVGGVSLSDEESQQKLDAHVKAVQP